MSDPFAISDNFLSADAPLHPNHAVAAIILNEDHQVLLQLRDDKKEIFFPHHWGCFGGGIEAGEEPSNALVRELAEELGMEFAADGLEKFITITFNLKMQEAPVDRHFYVVKSSNAAMQKIQLGEGSAFRVFHWHEVMRLANVTPYDKFALWIYFNQPRFGN